ncbi:MAG: Gfo/Idh/MocA family oxidoreductase [Chloroflexi bacterium]|nr:Gfo/Idh/MocA family oxidoreductase [Chloroflexota bacterium]
MKILMVGLGGIGQRHMRNLVSLLGGELELIAYRTRRLNTVLTDKLQVEPGINLEDQYDIRAFDNLDQALEQRPEIAFICNPTSLHVPAALQAASAGCHLFIEKPLSHDLQGVDELIDVVTRQHKVGFVGYQLRFHPCVRRLHTLIEEGAVGRVLGVRAEVGEYLPGWHTYEDYRQMYAARRDLGGGVVLSQIHELDYLYWLFGLPQSVYAVGGHLSSLEINVEDVASLLMSYRAEGGSFPVHLHQDYVQRPPSRTCQVIGDAGKILVDLNAVSLRLYNSSGELIEEIGYPGFPRNQLFLDELQHFLSCVREGRQPLISLQDGAQSLRMALAARESLQTGKVVPF